MNPPRMNLRYGFFGSPEFAAVILEKLISCGMPPAFVVVNPDKPAGRKKIITSSPVKLLALEHKSAPIEILQPEKLDADFIKKISALNADFFIVAAYAKIIPSSILTLPRLGVLGVHPSLLPKYRGASPVQSAILGGEKVTGVTIYALDSGMDSGPILKSADCTINDSDNFNSLIIKLAKLGADLLAEVLPPFVRGEIKVNPQNTQFATYTKKIITQDGFVDITKDKPDEIWRKIRALNPEPGVWTMQNGKRTKLLEAELVQNTLRIKKIQRDGKKPELVF